MSEPSKTPRLDRGRHPADLRNLSTEQLKHLAGELRAETIDAVSVTGFAFHAVFDTLRDRLIREVGHQAHPHKILTGRRGRIRTVRRGGSLSGFTRRAGSEYDPFGAAPSSSSISAGLGMAEAASLKGEDRKIVAVIGHGALSAGMARLVSSRPFLSLRELMGRMARRFPRPLEQAARLADEFKWPSDRRHVVLCRLDRWARSRSPHAGAAQSQEHGSSGSDAAALRDPEGQRLYSRRTQRRQKSWRHEVRCRYRRAIQGPAAPPSCTRVLFEALAAGAAADSRIVP